MFWVKKAAAGLMLTAALLTTGVGVGVSVRQGPQAAAEDKGTPPTRPKPAAAAKGASPTGPAPSPRDPKSATAGERAVAELKTAAEAYEKQLAAIESTPGNVVSEFERNGLRATVARLRAEIALAEWELEGGGLFRRPFPALNSPPPDAKSAAEAADLGRLQGLWQATALERNGQAAPADAVAKFRIDVRGHTMFINPGTENRAHAIDLDPTAAPKAMDLTPGSGPKEGRRLPCAIYELSGDVLRICISNEGESDRRPTRFETKPGDGFTLLTLRRVQPADAPPIPGLGVRDPAALAKQLADLEAEQKRMEAERAKLARMAEQLAVQGANLRAQLAAEAASTPESQILVAVAPDNAMNLTISVAEPGPGGKRLYAVLGDTELLRRLLARAKADPTAPKNLHIQVEPQASEERVQAVLAACQAAGFEQARLSGPIPAGVAAKWEIKTPAAGQPATVETTVALGRGAAATRANTVPRPTEAVPKPGDPTTGIKLRSDGAMTATGTDGLSFRLQRGGYGVLVVENVAARDLGTSNRNLIQITRDPENGQRFILQGLKAGTATLTLADTQLRAWVVTVTVTEE